MNAMRAMQWMLAPAALATIVGATAAGQTGGVGGGILGDRGVGQASRSRPRLVIELTTSAGTEDEDVVKLTIDAAGDATLEAGAAPIKVHFDAEQVAGVAAAIDAVPILPPRTRPHPRRDALERRAAYEQAGTLVSRSLHDGDAATAKLVDWLDDLGAMAQAGLLDDAAAPVAILGPIMDDGTGAELPRPRPDRRDRRLVVRLAG